MKKYLTLEEAEALLNGGLPQIGWRQLNEQKENLKAFEPFCELRPMIYAPYYDGAHHFEEATITIVYEGSILVPFRNYPHKSYFFRLLEKIRLENPPKFSESAPNYVGVPTKNKLDSWLKYLIARQNFLQKEVLTRKAVKENFLNRLTSAKNLTDATLHVFASDKDGQPIKGRLVQNSHSYHFEIADDGRAIYESITYVGANTLEAFIDQAHQ